MTDWKYTLFTEARTHSHWLEKPVPESVLEDIYHLMKFGPTSANMSPLRVVFVKTAAAKEKLKPHLDAGNVEKTMSAPVCAILGMDVHFYEKLPTLFPHANAKAWFDGLQEATLETIALRNSSLQAAYFMLAARGLGLDCGPMSGFNAAGVDSTFFAGTSIKTNMLCNLGYGDASKLHARNPRLDFSEVCRIV